MTKRKLLSLVLAFVLCLILIPVSTVKVDAETENGFTYTVSGGKATITKYTGSGGNVVIPSTLGGGPVTSIGDSAFFWCDSLTSVNIPDSVTSIGVNAFSSCFSLKSVTIGNGVSSIGNQAFSQCYNMNYINIPDSVKRIGNNAFSGCSGLTSITIPDSVTTIGGSAFSGCSGLTSITISDSLTSIGDQAFSGCSGLTSITIPDSVASIGTYAFGLCSGLESVVIGKGVSGIGDRAFSGCRSLSKVNYPGNQSQWDSISIGTGNDPLLNAEKVYNYNPLLGIEIVSLPNKTLFDLGENLVTTGLEINATYSNGSVETVTSGFTVSGFDSSTVGTKTLTVDYQGFTDTFEVTVREPVYSWLVVGTPPAKTVYSVGEDLDLTGLSLNVVSSDGSSQTVTSGYSVSGFDSSTVGAKTLTVRYQGYYTSFDVEVREAAPSVLYGDANGDGKIDTADLTLLRQYLADNSVILGPAA